MASATLEHRYEVAKVLARRAGNLAMQYYERREAINIQSKGVQNLVTDADKECEKLIARAVFEDFPGDCFLGEEAGFQNKGSSTIWIVDPIDGTSNFIRRIPFWCVSVGIAVDLRPVIGVVYDPVRDELYHSLAGEGAFRNDAAIAVSGVDSLDQAMVGLGFSYRRPIREHAAAVESCLAAHCEYNRLGSGSLSLAYVADGRLDGYWEGHMNSWDAAGGLALVLEAGGWSSDFFAGGGLENGNPILAATPRLAEPLMKLLAGRL
jgi:myo-inositol-1(or 4)-monophosphatase